MGKKATCSRQGEGKKQEAVKLTRSPIATEGLQRTPTTNPPPPPQRQEKHTLHLHSLSPTSPKTKKRKEKKRGQSGRRAWHKHHTFGQRQATDGWICTIPYYVPFFLFPFRAPAASKHTCMHMQAGRQAQSSMGKKPSLLLPPSPTTTTTNLSLPHLHTKPKKKAGKKCYPHHLHRTTHLIQQLLSAPNRPNHHRQRQPSPWLVSLHYFGAPGPSTYHTPHVREYRREAFGGGRGHLCKQTGVIRMYSTPTLVLPLQPPPTPLTFSFSLLTNYSLN